MMAAAIAAMTLGELLGPVAGDFAGLEVTDLVSDSREVTSGAAFFALAGATHDGIEFAQAARDAGAAIVLYEPSAGVQAPAPPALAVPDLAGRKGELAARFYRTDQVSSIGITGTNGKTTVAWLVSQAMSELDRPCGYIGTLGHGIPGSLEAHALTTPDCLALHRIVSRLGTAHAAIEVSSHALSQNRTAGLSFDIAAFTNLSRDHLDWHVTMDEYFAAKARLFESPAPAAAVINLADGFAPALIGRLAADTRLVTVAADQPAGANIVGTVTTRGVDGIGIAVDGLFGKSQIESSLIGAFNAENLLVALGVLAAAGVDVSDACRVLSSASAPPGRMEVIRTKPGSPRVIVDFAHTPDALERVLTELSRGSEGELTCVFGCGGERDRGKRHYMGAVAARYAAHITLTDDNPRGEDPVAIIADIKAGIGRHPDLRVEHRREIAIRQAIEAAGPEDLILIAGKGHETEQLIGGTRYLADDRELARNALEALS